MSVEAFLANNPGFIPSEYPPDKWGELADREIEHRLCNRPGVICMDAAGPTRNVYFERGLAEIRDPLKNCRVYNQVTDPDSRRRNANILAEDEPSQAIQDHVLGYLRQKQPQVVLPFAGEKETIERGILYAADRVGMQNVLAVDTGVQPEATEKAKRTGVKVIDRRRVMECIDFELFKERGILPEWVQLPMDGHKGMNLYAALFALEAMGLLNGRIVLGDTDIVQPGPIGRLGIEGEYCYLEHLAIPRVFPIGEAQDTGGYILRTGEGRNNEPLTLVYNLLPYLLSAEELQMIEKEPEKFKKILKISIALATIGWPSTGERDFNGAIRRFPVAIGMDTETGWNFNQVGMGIEMGVRNIVQVANPNPKIENRPSPRDREFAMIFEFSAFAVSIAKMIWRTGKFLHEWDLDIISQYNHDFGGRKYAFFVPAAEDHHNVAYADTAVSYMLPSVQQARDLDAVDWTRLRELMS